MNTRKIENIIIIILVLLNLFLLAVVLSDHAQARRSQRETAETVTALLAENGIQAAPEALQLGAAPPICTVTRDLEREADRTESLIGSAGVEDLGGSIRFYRGEGGQIVLRGTGEMDMLPAGGSVPVRGSREKTAQKLFADAGAETCVWRVSEAEERVECCCLWDGLPVYNARLAFDFSGDSLFMVTGTMLFTRETERKSEGVMDAVSVLMRFLEYIRSEGLICSRLDAVSPGYLMAVTVSGESTLTPVWHIETDTGDYYMNAVSGKAETVD